MNGQKSLYFLAEVAPTTLDPARAFDLVSRNVTANLFEGLVVQDSVTLQVRPGLASHWQVVDGRHYTFTLRPDTRFSTGEPITADDVVFSLGRVVDFLGEQVQIEAESPLQITVRIAQENPRFLEMLATPVCSIVSHKAVETAAIASTNSGPFMLKEIVGQGSQHSIIVLERNPYYWDAQSVVLSRVILLTVPSAEERVRLYESRQTANGARLPFIVHHAPPSRFREWQGRTDLRQFPVLGTICFTVNTTVKPMDNPLVRKALGLALNRQAILKEIAPHVKEATGLIPHQGGVVPGEKNELYDPHKAARLLAIAGYPDGKGFPAINMTILDYPYQVEMAKRFSQDLKEGLGITVQVGAVDWHGYLQRAADQDFGLLYETWHTAFADPATFLSSLTTGNSFNTAGYSNSGFDALIQEALAEPNMAVRSGLLRKAEEIAMADMPLIPLFYRTHLSLVDAGIKGFHESPSGVVRFKEISVETVDSELTWPEELSPLQGVLATAAGTLDQGGAGLISGFEKGPNRFTQAVRGRYLSEW